MTGTGAVLPHTAGACATQYTALLEVSRAIAVSRDLQGLFDQLAGHFHRVLAFDYILLVLHDDARNVMRLHVVGQRPKPPALSPEIIWSAEPHSASPCTELPIEESAAGWVWQTQQPLVFGDPAREARFPRVMQILREHAIRSSCFLPLTTAHRRLGAIGLGSAVPGAFSDYDLEFLQLAAAQVAVAVDNALNHESARSLQRELSRERDRLQSLLDVNTAAASTLDLGELFHAISARLRRLMRCDYASLLLADADGSELRLHGLDFPAGKGFLQEGMRIPLDGSPSGEAFRTRRAQILRRNEIAALDPAINPAVPEGIRAGCFLPLISRDRVLGTLNLGWLGDEVLEQEEIDFLVEAAAHVAIAVENALHYRQVTESSQKLAEEKLYLEEEIRTENNFEEIIGSSPALIRVLKQVETVAPTDSTVLIEGETGAGKEVIARAIHQLSSRRDRTFVKLNCAAIPTGLLESELFGHEKGAFTGAIAQKIGRFELADKGTLFLDEIGDIPLELQPKLLRVLQEQEFERLGATRTHRVNIRLIAATNRNLSQLVATKEFRSDLYYRLNVFPVTVPPLRDRPEDIELLTRHFVQKHARLMKRPIESIPRPALEALARYAWPGNVRELEHFIERAVIMTRGPVLELPVSELSTSAAELAPRPPVTFKEAEREAILRALEESNWVIGGPKGAASRLGLGRTTLQYKMQRLGIVRRSSAAASS